MLRRLLSAKVRVALVTTSALTVLFGSGCGDDEPATPRVTLNTALSSSSVAGAPECANISGSWLSIGTFGNPNANIQAQPVDDGGEFAGGSVAVDCLVHPTNDGFDVRASATLNGDQGGSFRVVGTFLAGQDSPNIQISISRLGSTFQQSDCTATFDGVPSVKDGPISSGRVWAYVKCPNAVDEAHQRACEAYTQLRFENCSQ